MATSVRRRVERKASKWTGYHRILWPTDFSALAQAALSHAVGLASDAGAELVLLHVLPPQPLFFESHNRDIRSIV